MYIEALVVITVYSISYLISNGVYICETDLPIFQ